MNERKIELTHEDLFKRGLVRDGKGFPYNPDNLSYAKYLRKNMTGAELKLWNNFLKKNKYKFYKQRLIDHYIIDFYCSKKSLVIEIDGEIHNSRKEYDLIRTEILELYGLKVIRFSNEEVFNEFEYVCNKINKFCT